VELFNERNTEKRKCADGIYEEASKNRVPKARLRLVWTGLRAVDFFEVTLRKKKNQNKKCPSTARQTCDQREVGIGR